MRIIYFVLASLLISFKVYAQVTLNFDDFSEDFISEKKVEHSQKIQLTPISHDEPEKTQEKKTVVTKKSVVKKEKIKTPPPKKVVKKNYIVKERSLEDDHDKLKPRSEPVPVVKIQEIEKQIKQDLLKDEVSASIKNDSQVKNTESNSSAKLENLSENNSPTNLDYFPSLKNEAISTTKAVENKESIVSFEKKQENTYFNQNKNLSVLSVNESNLQRRSDELKKFIPADSKTFSDLQKKKFLYLILVFEKKSSHLTEDMESWIEKVALELQKNKKFNLIIYSYSGPTDPEFGREHHLSLQRALRVRSSFSRRGITVHRISYRSWGKIGAGDKYPDRVDILLSEK